MHAEDGVRRADGLADLQERETPAGDGVRKPREFRHARRRDRGGRVRIAARLLLEKAVAVGLEKDEHRLSEVLHALHEDLEVAEVRFHRGCVLHLREHRGLAATGLADDLVVLDRGHVALRITLLQVREAPRAVVAAVAPVVHPALGEIAVPRAPRDAARLHPRASGVLEHSDEELRWKPCRNAPCGAARCERIGRSLDDARALGRRGGAATEGKKQAHDGDGPGSVHCVPSRMRERGPPRESAIR